MSCQKNSRQSQPFSGQSISPASCRKSRSLVRIRPAVPSDASAIISLEKKCFNHPWSEDAIRKDLSLNSNAFYLVAEDTELRLIVAFASCWQMVDDAELMRIATHPDYRRRGLADMLLDQVITKAKNLGLHALFLEVRSSNQAAGALYQRHGFKTIRIRKQYYDDNREDAIIMSKDLS